MKNGQLKPGDNTGVATCGEYVMQELDFRRFLLRGNTKVAAEWLLSSLALSILRLHQRIQTGAWKVVLRFRRLFLPVYSSICSTF